jgi:hypothetical protein
MCLALLMSALLAFGNGGFLSKHLQFLKSRHLLEVVLGLSRFFLVVRSLASDADFLDTVIVRIHFVSIKIHQ